MVTIGLALAMKKDKLWDPLSEKEKKQLSSWLYQVNQCELAENNWLFFPVIVNLGLKKVMEPYNQKVMETALCRIEDCYLGNGWYSDGISKQRDYYIAFAMIFTDLFMPFCGERRIQPEQNVSELELLYLQKSLSIGFPQKEMPCLMGEI